MQTRTEYPAGVPCFVDTGRKNADPAIAFYGGLFGWDAQNVSPEGAPRYHMATLHGHTVAGIGEQDFQTWDPVWNQYVQVEDADATAKEVEQAGGEVKMDPFAIGSAGRMAVFADPHGAEICVWEPGETKGLGLVNTPCTEARAPFRVGSPAPEERRTHEERGAPCRRRCPRATAFVPACSA